MFLIFVQATKLTFFWPVNTAGQLVSCSFLAGFVTSTKETVFFPWPLQELISFSDESRGGNSTHVFRNHALHVSALYIRTYVHTYIHTYLFTYLHTYKLAYLHACMLRDILTLLTYLLACMHAYMHACIHTHIIYINIYDKNNNSSSSSSNGSNKNNKT